MTYLGFDVLELNYNRIGPAEERLRRKFALLDPKTGKRTSIEHSPAPAPARPFTWTALGRSEVAAMRAFLDARKGCAVPFWFPSYQWDLSLTEDALQGDSILTIAWIRYEQQMFGTTAGRRHLAIWPCGLESPMDYHEIVNATDPGNGETETIGINPVATRAYSAPSTVISFLKLCRLDADSVRISYPKTHIAEATIQVRELPLEAPISA